VISHNLDAASFHSMFSSMRMVLITVTFNVDIDANLQAIRNIQTPSSRHCNFLATTKFEDDPVLARVQRSDSMPLSKPEPVCSSLALSTYVQDYVH
jgi:hypothetical protein